MRISDWSSDVCSSDLGIARKRVRAGSSVLGGRNFGIAGCEHIARPRGGGEQGFGFGDPACDPCRFGIGGQRKARREIEVALDAEPAGQADGFDFRQAERAKFRSAETKKSEEHKYELQYLTRL